MPDTKSQKILFVISSMRNGGTQKIVKDLFIYFKSFGCEIKVVTFDKKFGSYNYMIKKFSICLNLSKRSKTIFHAFFYNFKRILSLRKIIRQNPEAKVVSFLYSTNVITILSKFGLENKLIVCERNDMEHQKVGVMWHGLRRFLYRYANRVTTNNKKNCKILEKYTKKEKIFFIPNHIRPKKLNINRKKKIILSVGRLHTQKGFDILVKSFSSTKALHNNWKLVIVGQGKEEKDLKKLVNKLNLKDKISFQGFANPYSWYRKSSIFVLSSRFEGTPNVLLEAMSMKLPVIITDRCPGGMYYVKNNLSGLVVSSYNVLALSKAIDKLIYNKGLRNKLAKGSLSYVKKLADHRKIFKQWHQSIFN